jgi:hypothetical protein
MGKRFVYSTLGFLLLTVAALKLYGLNVTPFAQYGRLMNPTVQFLALEWEITLGIWLLAGRRPMGAWVAALLTFLAFAGVSLHLGIIGQASCGCFGALKASPWHAFAVDVAALVLLAFARPNFQVLREVNGDQWLSVVWQNIGLVLVLIAFCGGTAGLAAVSFGSVDATLARLRGERISVQPRLVDMGGGQPGQTLQAAVEIVNRTDQPVTITGGTSDCSCVTTNELPITIAPGESRQVAVDVRLPANPGFFNRKAYLWTNCPGARRLLFGLTGKIEAPVRESAAVSR